MTHQGFAASIGTSALLVGAAVSILLAVGAFLAFQGFPGPSGAGPAESFLLESSQGAVERPDPQLVLPASTDSARSGASAAASAVAAPDDFFTPPDSAVASAVPATPPAPVVPTGPAQVGGEQSGSGSSSNGDGTLGTTVDRVSDGVRTTSRSVDGVLPGRDAVSRTTSPLVDTVDDLSSTLDRVERRLGD